MDQHYETLAEICRREWDHAFDRLIVFHQIKRSYTKGFVKAPIPKLAVRGIATSHTILAAIVAMSLSISTT